MSLNNILANSLKQSIANMSKKSANLSPSQSTESQIVFGLNGVNGVALQNPVIFQQVKGKS